MFVQRMTITVKPGHMEKILGLLKENREKTGVDSRLYQIDIGTYNQIAIELEFETMADYEKGWAEWNARPDTPAFMEKWLEWTKGGTNEIWQLVK